MTTTHSSPKQPAGSMVKICPHLGIEEDPQTCLGYPSPWNYCHRAQPALAVRAGYQRSTCLRGLHATCSVFQNADPQPLPQALQVKRKPRVR